MMNNIVPIKAVDTLIELVQEQKATLLGTCIGFVIGGVTVYWYMRWNVQQIPHKTRPTPINTSRATLVVTKVTPPDQIDTSPPAEYGSNAPDPDMPGYHELMEKKKAQKAMDEAFRLSRQRVEQIMKDQEKARSMRWSLFGRRKEATTDEYSPDGIVEEEEEEEQEEEQEEEHEEVEEKGRSNTASEASVSKIRHTSVFGPVLGEDKSPKKTMETVELRR